METNTFEFCPKCSKPLSKNGFFCGSCLTQVKCKSCETFLEVDFIGCPNCGTSKEIQNIGSKNANTFKFHETLSERTIEATFSDNVGKDLASILKEMSRENRKSIDVGNDFGNKEDIIDVSIINDNVSDSEINDNSDKDEPSNDLEIKENNIKNIECPALISIAMKNLPETELEWLIVYSFYASNQGDKIFNRDEIIERYKESNRFDDVKTKKQLTSYIKIAVQKGYINALQNGFSLLDEGKDKAVEIMNRKSSATPKIRNFKTKREVPQDEAKTRKPSKGTGYKRLNDINFYPEGKTSLVDFIKQYQFKNDNERNLIFTYYLKNILGLDKITLDHLYTCYDEVDNKIPLDMSKSVSNTTNRKGWLVREDSNIIITTKGLNEIKFWKGEKK